jgi:hypothetical protein
MVRTNLLTEEQAAAAELAVSEGKSMAELVRQGVDFVFNSACSPPKSDSNGR